MTRFTQLPDEQWILIEDLFAWEAPNRSERKPSIPPRVVLEALHWMLRNGGPWENHPQSFPSELTCRRRLPQWVENGVLEGVWARLVELSDALGWIDSNHLIADGTFCRAKRKRYNSSCSD